MSNPVYSNKDSFVRSAADKGVFGEMDVEPETKYHDSESFINHNSSFDHMSEAVMYFFTSLRRSQPIMRGNWACSMVLMFFTFSPGLGGAFNSATY